MSNILTGLNKIDIAAGGTGNANNITEGLMNIEKSLSGSSSEDNITGLLDKISESYSGGSGSAEITGSFIVENGLLKGQTLTVTIPENVTDVKTDLESYYGILCAEYSSDQIPFIKLIIKNKDLIKEDPYEGVFGQLNSVNSIVLPEGITEIQNQLFSYNSRLSEVIIPEGVIKIGSSAFADGFGGGAGGFKVILPKSLKRIEEMAFYQTVPTITNGVVDMVIPENVQYIGDLALEFKAPSNGQHYSVIIEAINPPTIGSTIFSGDYIDNIYVPAQSVEAYKTAQVWSQYYTNKIAPIPEE